MAYWTLCVEFVVVSNEEKCFIQMTETETKTENINNRL